MKALSHYWFVRAISLCALGLLTQAGDCSSTFRLNQQFAPSQVANITSRLPVSSDAKTAKASKLPMAGDVLIAGGVSGTKSTSSAQFYDPTTKKFTKTGALTIDRAAPCGLSLATTSTGNQPILLAGGAQVSAKTKGAITLTMTSLSSAEEYDPNTGTSTALTKSMSQSRVGCTATSLDDGTILIAGGLDASGNPQNTAEIFDPVAGTFTPTLGNMLSPRAFHTATYIQTGTVGEVLIAGGLANNASTSGQQGLTLNTAELYNPTSKTFSLVASTMSDFRAFHTATLLNDGTVLIAGGDSDQFPGAAFGATATADIFNPVTQTFTPTTGPLIEPLLLQGATLLQDGSGKVLITGGFDAAQIVVFTSGGIGAFFGTVAQGAEIYDPALKTFSCIGGTITVSKTSQTVCASVMKHPHAGHAAVLLNDGTVLVAGGFGGSKNTSNAKTTKVAEIYGPTTGNFTKVGSMKTGVVLGEAALILGPAIL